MPEEQPTPAESEADIKEPQPNLEKPDASDSDKASTIDPPAQAESTATTPDSSTKVKPADTPSDSPKSAPKSSSQAAEKKRLSLLRPIELASRRLTSPNQQDLSLAKGQKPQLPKETSLRPTLLKAMLALLQLKPF